MAASKFYLLLAFFFLTVLTVSSQNSIKNALAEQSENDRIGVVYKSNLTEPVNDSELKKIKEVFGSRADELVLNNSAYLKDLKHLLRNRILIYEMNDLSKQKKTKLLSEVPLNKTYNSGITRDVKFDIENFNPLKYQLDFFSKGTYVYQVDGTDYFIQITSQYRQ
ncbi:MAG: hypothetical protein AAF688_02690 [Bacteroidota bacterium]